MELGMHERFEEVIRENERLKIKIDCLNELIVHLFVKLEEQEEEEE